MTPHNRTNKKKGQKIFLSIFCGLFYRIYNFGFKLAESPTLRES